MSFEIIIYSHEKSISIENGYFHFLILIPAPHENSTILMWKSVLKYAPEVVIPRIVA